MQVYWKAENNGQQMLSKHFSRAGRSERWTETRKPLRAFYRARIGEYICLMDFEVLFKRNSAMYEACHLNTNRLRVHTATMVPISLQTVTD